MRSTIRFSVRHTILFSVRTLFALVVLLSATTVSAQVYDSPEKAKADPDFALQGEYVDSTRGLQVIAMGDEEFQIVTYASGLPGAGWDGKEKKRIDVDVDAVEALISKFKRVDRKSPTLGAKPPSGAVVLFDGTKESLEKHWKAGAKITDDGLLQQGCTSIDTFGDYALHLEFRTPFAPKARGQGRGNSGLYHQGRYETQVLDSFGLEGEMNETGGIYSIRKPDLNMCLPPLTWQTYDVEFTAARYDDDGKLVTNAKITVNLNGVVIHRDVELPKSTTAAPVKLGPENGPIYLQDHGNPVRYRNIWVRPRDVAAEARRPIVPGFERFHAGAGDLTAGGQLLLGELNCVACHKTNESLTKLIQPKQAPILDKVGQRIKPEWMLKYIANPHDVKPGTTMPDLMAGMDNAQRNDAAIALTNFLVGNDVLNARGKGANTGAGERLFHESGCVSCHMPRNGEKANAATSIPLVGIEDKYSRASLEAFLKDPLAVRPSGRMPQMNLEGDNWRHVAQYLTGDETSSNVVQRRDLPKEPNMKAMVYFKEVSDLPNLDTLKPDREQVSRGLDISVAGRDSNFIVSFRGYLPIAKPGNHLFRLSSDDGSVLYIDGKKIIDNDGVHANDSKQNAIRLDAGIHEIRVDYFEAGGEEVLTLDWEIPGQKMAAIDKAIVMTRDGSAPIKPAKAQTQPVDPDVFVFDPSKVDQGRKLFSSLGCASCHVRNESGKRIESTRSAPELASINATNGCMAQSPSNVPNYDLTGGQIESLTAALKTGAPQGDVTADMQLAHTMKSLNCYACHQRDAIGGSESDRNQFFISTIPEMGDEGRLPPPLDGVGDKLRKEWINNVVSNGNKSRPYMRTYMPKFGNANAGHLADVFAALDQRTEAKIDETTESEKRRVAIGRKMVGSKGLGCVSCHTFGKFKSSGIQAIALDTMANRIREDWFHRYLPDPQAYRPGTRMPTGYPDGKSTVTDIYDGDQQKQLAAMWSFLSKGTGGGAPEGISGGEMELKPTDKPIIYRNFIEGVSPRGIAVGYPEKANLCWDANNLSLTLLWQDRFIDASKHWVGRGQGNQFPFGGGVYTLEKVTPIARLQDLKTPWPTDSPRQRGYRFLGYRLDDRGQPTFRYRGPAFQVQDKPVPVLGDVVSSFRREIDVKPSVGAKVAGDLYFRAGVGKKIETDNNNYVIDDDLTIRLNQKPTLRTVNGQTELLVPITGDTTIIQEIIW